MQKIKDTLSIWWRQSNPAQRLAGIWVGTVLTALLLVLLFTGILLKALFVIAVIVIPASTIVCAIYVSEQLVAANRKRKKADRIRAAYTYKGPEFRPSSHLDN